MKLIMLIEAIQASYRQQIWQQLIQQGVPEHDANELMMTNAVAIQQEERDRIPVAWPVKHLIAKWRRQQEQQRTADAGRDSHEAERLAADIRSGKRPRPSYLPKVTPALQQEVGNIFRAAPRTGFEAITGKQGSFADAKPIRRRFDGR